MSEKFLITDVSDCARCRGDHTKLVFARMTHPAGEWTHWAPCPANNEPVMMQVIDEHNLQYNAH